MRLICLVKSQFFKHCQLFCKKGLAAFTHFTSTLIKLLNITFKLKNQNIEGPIARQLVQDNSLNGEMAAHIMAAVLNALTLHGQHEANQGLLLTLGAQIYELLRPSFLEVFGVMQQIPGVNPVDLQKLDERISGGTSKGNKIEKVKKDLFKKLTGNVGLKI